MKQIFDSMRGAILDKAYKIYDGTVGVDIHDVGNIINEAEAKWESDCCEWETHRYLNVHKTSCGMAIGDYHKAWDFCPYCGKPIKISEVE